MRRLHPAAVIGRGKYVIQGVNKTVELNDTLAKVIPYTSPESSSPYTWSIPAIK
jgi:hypothetical protein